jgi:hypothetical protein
MHAVVSFLRRGRHHKQTNRAAVRTQQTLTLIKPNALREIADDLP